MALCEITGTLYLPDGEPAKFYTVYLTRTDKRVVRDYNGAVVPQMVKVQTAQDGSVDFSILTGSYNGIARPSDTSGGSTQYSFTFNVPDAASALFQDCIDAVAPPSPQPVWYDNLSDEISDISDIALSNEESLEGSPWQVVATDAESGKAVTRDLTFSAVVDFPGPGWMDVGTTVIVPYYAVDEVTEQVFEEKARWAVATQQDTVGTLVKRDENLSFECSVTSRPKSVINRAAMEAAIRASLAPVGAILALSYPQGVANPPTAEPANNSAFLPGAEARHTNPGSNQGGGIAFGMSARINGLHHVALGPLIEIGPRNGSDAYDLTMTGTSHSVAVGGATVVSVNNGVALGARAKVRHVNSVALGADAETDAVDTVSVGNATVKRRITNAADPTGPQDAATKAYVDRALDVQVFATYAEALAYSTEHPSAIVFSEEAAP